MSLEFMDGFDHYRPDLNNVIQRKWDTTSSAGNAAGRFGGNSASPGNFIQLTQGQLTSQGTRIIGFAIYYTSAGFNGTGEFLQFVDGVTLQCKLMMTGNGSVATITLVDHSGTVQGTHPTTLVPNVWTYMEVKAVIGSAGSMQVKIGGNSYTATFNTQGSSNATTNGIILRNGGNFTNSYNIDDLYILNTLGTLNNNFLGECRIYTMLPANDNVSTPSTNLMWTPDSGSVHYSRVNENPPDDDTSYVYSATAGQIDTYRFGAISPTGAIGAVQVVLCERKDDVGTRNTSVEYRSAGGTNYAGGNTFAPGSQYMMDRQIYETDPATGAAWILANVNNAEFGIRCVL